MKNTKIIRTGALAATALTLTLGLAACGDDADETSADTSADTSSETTDSGDDAAAEASASDQVFGPACSAVPTDGKGSFDGMVNDPVATAASNNPLLGTLVTAVTEAGLVDTLNGAEALTVFAPTDDAFGAIPEKDLNAVLADKETLTAILTHHVIGEQLDPDAIVGEQDTLNNDTVTVEGDVDGMTVQNGETPANVLCGNVPTANATVYVIDAVLMP
ncbi:Cell surface lipoprotein MPB83 precursor [Nocardioides dokdonensis FR1436]|uniref:Cell surface lipoprotein MPB83 n=1 Tax=Nocardioides dokdonensis FR1436 TaxID=1300347 RepID=A0A1A9GIK7_9ACTN|nr:fasciclin domain-containing protein [Nocardioides dokdonensis]ANH37520.1 Cell surface lipoprotein MPB83 precursor [Nocardioides dokdonensis FR1436]